MACKLSGIIFDFSELYMIRQIGYKLGLTNDVRVELSDLFKSSAVVIDKRHRPIDSTLLYLGMWDKEKYLVRFAGDGIEFFEDNRKFFDMFDVGEEVIVSYKELIVVRTDYIPPNFDDKQEVDRSFAYNKLVGAEKKI